MKEFPLEEDYLQPGPSTKRIQPTTINSRTLFEAADVIIRRKEKSSDPDDFLFSKKPNLPQSNFHLTGRFCDTVCDRDVDRIAHPPNEELQNSKRGFYKRNYHNIWEFENEAEFFYGKEHRSVHPGFPSDGRFFSADFKKLFEWCRPNPRLYFAPGSTPDEQLKKLRCYFKRSSSRYEKYLKDINLPEGMAGRLRKLELPPDYLLFFMHHMGLHIAGFMRCYMTETGKFILHNAYMNYSFTMFRDGKYPAWDVQEKLVYFYLTMRSYHELEYRLDHAAELAGPEAKSLPNYRMGAIVTNEKMDREMQKTAKLNEIIHHKFFTYSVCSGALRLNMLSSDERSFIKRYKNVILIEKISPPLDKERTDIYVNLDYIERVGAFKRKSVTNPPDLPDAPVAILKDQQLLPVLYGSALPVTSPDHHSHWRADEIISDPEEYRRELEQYAREPLSQQAEEADDDPDVQEVDFRQPLFVETRPSNQKRFSTAPASYVHDGRAIQDTQLLDQGPYAYRAPFKQTPAYNISSPTKTQTVFPTEHRIDYTLIKSSVMSKASSSTTRPQQAKPYHEQQQNLPGALQRSIQRPAVSWFPPSSKPPINIGHRAMPGHKAQAENIRASHRASMVNTASTSGTNAGRSRSYVSQRPVFSTPMLYAHGEEGDHSKQIRSRNYIVKEAAPGRYVAPAPRAISPEINVIDDGPCPLDAELNFSKVAAEQSPVHTIASDRILVPRTTTFRIATMSTKVPTTARTPLGTATKPIQFMSKTVSTARPPQVFGSTARPIQAIAAAARPSQPIIDRGNSVATAPAVCGYSHAPRLPDPMRSTARPLDMASDLLESAEDMALKILMESRKYIGQSSTDHDETNQGDGKLGEHFDGAWLLDACDIEDLCAQSSQENFNHIRDKEPIEREPARRGRPPNARRHPDVPAVEALTAAQLAARRPRTSTRHGDVISGFYELPPATKKRGKRAKTPPIPPTHVLVSQVDPLGKRGKGRVKQSHLPRGKIGAHQKKLVCAVLAADRGDPLPADDDAREYFESLVKEGRELNIIHTYRSKMFKAPPKKKKPAKRNKHIIVPYVPVQPRRALNPDGTKKRKKRAKSILMPKKRKRLLLDTDSVDGEGSLSSWINNHEVLLADYLDFGNAFKLFNIRCMENQENGKPNPDYDAFDKLLCTTNKEFWATNKDAQFERDMDTAKTSENDTDNAPEDGLEQDEEINMISLVVEEHHRRRQQIVEEMFRSVERRIEDREENRENRVSSPVEREPSPYADVSFCSLETSFDPEMPYKANDFLSTASNQPVLVHRVDVAFDNTDHILEQQSAKIVEDVNPEASKFDDNELETLLELPAKDNSEGVPPGLDRLDEEKTVEQKRRVDDRVAVADVLEEVLSNVAESQETLRESGILVEELVKILVGKEQEAVEENEQFVEQEILEDIEETDDSVLLRYLQDIQNGNDEPEEESPTPLLAELDPQSMPMPNEMVAKMKDIDSLKEAQEVISQLLDDVDIATQFVLEKEVEKLTIVKDVIKEFKKPFETAATAGIMEGKCIEKIEASLLEPETIEVIFELRARERDEKEATEGIHLVTKAKETDVVAEFSIQETKVTFVLARPTSVAEQSGLSVAINDLREVSLTVPEMIVEPEIEVDTKIAQMLEDVVSQVEKTSSLLEVAEEEEEEEEEEASARSDSPSRKERKRDASYISDTEQSETPEIQRRKRMFSHSDSSAPSSVPQIDLPTENETEPLIEETEFTDTVIDTATEELCDMKPRAPFRRNQIDDLFVEVREPVTEEQFSGIQQPMRGVIPFHQQQLTMPESFFPERVLPNERHLFQNATLFPPIREFENRQFEQPQPQPMGAFSYMPGSLGTYSMELPQPPYRPSQGAYAMRSAANQHNAWGYPQQFYPYPIGMPGPSYYQAPLQEYNFVAPGMSTTSVVHTPPLQADLPLRNIYADVDRVNSSHPGSVRYADIPSTSANPPPFYQPQSPAPALQTSLPTSPANQMHLEGISPFLKNLIDGEAENSARKRIEKMKIVEDEETGIKINMEALLTTTKDVDVDRNGKAKRMSPNKPAHFQKLPKDLEQYLGKKPTAANLAAMTSLHGRLARASLALTEERTHYESFGAIFSEAFMVHAVAHMFDALQYPKGHWMDISASSMRTVILRKALELIENQLESVYREEGDLTGPNPKDPSVSICPLLLKTLCRQIGGRGCLMREEIKVLPKDENFYNSASDQTVRETQTLRDQVRMLLNVLPRKEQVPDGDGELSVLLHCAVYKSDCSKKNRQKRDIKKRVACHHFLAFSEIIQTKTKEARVIKFGPFRAARLQEIQSMTPEVLINNRDTKCGELHMLKGDVGLIHCGPGIYPDESGDIANFICTTPEWRATIVEKVKETRQVVTQDVVEGMESGPGEVDNEEIYPVQEQTLAVMELNESYVIPRGAMETRQLLEKIQKARPNFDREDVNDVLRLSSTRVPVHAEPRLNYHLAKTVSMNATSVQMGSNVEAFMTTLIQMESLMLETRNHVLRIESELKKPIVTAEDKLLQTIRQAQWSFVSSMKYVIIHGEAQWMRFFFCTPEKVKNWNADTDRSCWNQIKNFQKFYIDNFTRDEINRYLNEIKDLLRNTEASEEDKLKLVKERALYILNGLHIPSIFLGTIDNDKARGDVEELCSFNRNPDLAPRWNCMYRRNISDVNTFGAPLHSFVFSEIEEKFVYGRKEEVRLALAEFVAQDEHQIISGIEKEIEMHSKAITSADIPFKKTVEYIQKIPNSVKDEVMFYYVRERLRNAQRNCIRKLREHIPAANKLFDQIKDVRPFAQRTQEQLVFDLDPTSFGPKINKLDQNMEFTVSQEWPRRPGGDDNENNDEESTRPRSQQGRAQKRRPQDDDDSKQQPCLKQQNYGTQREAAHAYQPSLPSTSSVCWETQSVLSEDSGIGSCPSIASSGSIKRKHSSVTNIPQIMTENLEVVEELMKTAQCPEPTVTRQEIMGVSVMDSTPLLSLKYLSAPGTSPNSTNSTESIDSSEPPPKRSAPASKRPTPLATPDPPSSLDPLSIVIPTSTERRHSEMFHTLLNVATRVFRDSRSGSEDLEVWDTSRSSRKYTPSPLSTSRPPAESTPGCSRTDDEQTPTALEDEEGEFVEEEEEDEEEDEEEEEEELIDVVMIPEAAPVLEETIPVKEDKALPLVKTFPPVVKTNASVEIRDSKPLTVLDIPPIDEAELGTVLIPKKPNTFEFHFFNRIRYTVEKNWAQRKVIIGKSLRAGRGKRAHCPPTADAKQVHKMFMAGKTDLNLILKGAKLDFIEMEKQWDLDHGSKRLEPILPPKHLVMISSLANNSLQARPASIVPQQVDILISQQDDATLFVAPRPPLPKAFPVAKPKIVTKAALKELPPMKMMPMPVKQPTPLRRTKTKLQHIPEEAPEILAQEEIIVEAIKAPVKMAHAVSLAERPCVREASPSSPLIIDVVGVSDDVPSPIPGCSYNFSPEAITNNFYIGNSEQYIEEVDEGVQLDLDDDDFDRLVIDETSPIPTDEGNSASLAIALNSMRIEIPPHISVELDTTPELSPECSTDGGEPIVVDSCLSADGLLTPNFNRYTRRLKARRREICHFKSFPKLPLEPLFYQLHFDRLRRTVNTAEKEKGRLLNTTRCEAVSRKLNASPVVRRSRFEPKRPKSADVFFGRKVDEHYGEHWNLAEQRMYLEDLKLYDSIAPVPGAPISRCNTPATIMPWDASRTEFQTKFQYKSQAPQFSRSKLFLKHASSQSPHDALCAESSDSRSKREFLL